MTQKSVNISRKKPTYPVSPSLQKYLKAYQREAKLPIAYKDLLNFSETVPVLDKLGNDTLWETPLYSSHDVEKIHNGLKIAYAILKASGNIRVIEHKYI